ncbi:uncharacterized protein PITG_07658 [Phytophthora infestans T30-4]|uniref:Uncharacterized protein n=1 Tax=Phytophthora infestans (strain T30-4) TaxID=403677 RepID=D0N8U3_PHYIT|nr:uncharacterized protein PITG_07658 [Phytophthora infestans T30-4]EEY53978.1 hypothetical protein PITG_07658 [Phytophthora infestans T30-4]|eukprot:XP_002904609.1 hypothetical protein PITG_07658 [Phytophthora infestans T30-4]
MGEDDEQVADHDSAEEIALAEQKPLAVSGKKGISDVEIRYKMPDVPLATKYKGSASVLEYPISDYEMEERFWKFGGVVENWFSLKQERAVFTIKDLTKPIEQITNRGHPENLLTI